ncbi:hypothetical protein MF271_00610 (plasmid) [Deinococcus sp. KNUC1210]|uniref:hypothetical protein n=1 Tax=Deinococcus sp. KNUC1210 TaxID=2917691 RepID=UPI001EF15A96|nr:hypothetical protein [Deinococcus sp. KNUC1210]ULH14014.1 hypothetical protein MF271_00610 [Deinococcus sp. KNUC1210]
MKADELAQVLALDYAAIPQVVAVVQAGSRTAGNQDRWSDIDLYIYSRETVPLSPGTRSPSGTLSGGKWAIPLRRRWTC